MRCADPEAKNPERHYMQQFFLEGADVKHLYQVLHEHYQKPNVIPSSWYDDAKKPDQKIKVRGKYGWQERPHEHFPDRTLEELRGK